MKVKAQVTHIGKGTHACETPHLQLAAQQNELLQRRVQDASRRAAQRADQWKWTVHVQWRVEPSEKINARFANPVPIHRFLLRGTAVLFALY